MESGDLAPISLDDGADSRDFALTSPDIYYATRETLILSPLPCWKHLTVQTRRRLAADLIAEIEAEAAVRRQGAGRQVLGAAIRKQHPFRRPKRSKKSPAPLFHAASQAVRKGLYEAYAWFVAEYAAASEKLLAGDRTVAFPTGSFPPALPFVAG